MSRATNNVATYFYLGLAYHFKGKIYNEIADLINDGILQVVLLLQVVEYDNGSVNFCFHHLR